MDGILHAPGFLGTNANFAADMTLVLSLLVAAVFTYGALLAKTAQRVESRTPAIPDGKIIAARLFRRHRYVQTGGAVLNIILVLWMMLLPYRDFILRDSGGPREGVFYTVTNAHALLGLFAFLFGNFVVLRGNHLMIASLRFSNYKPFMRVAYVAYMLTTLLGVGVYITWFIITEKPPVF